MIKKFQLKPDPITAIQWTGTNTAEVCEFCGAKYICSSEHRNFIEIPGNCAALDIAKSDWVVEKIYDDFDYCYEVWSDYKMKKNYNEVIE
jgi:hypothetical protein